MRYFTFELIAAANDWIEQTESAHRKAERRFETVAKRYQRQLDALESRVSQQAWRFFRYGFGRDGLHDARLLKLTVGDGLDYTRDGSLPFRLNRQPASASIEFLNYEQDLYYTFGLRGVKSVKSDLFVDEDSFAKSFGDLYTYELTAVDKEHLQLGFVFASGATIVAQFRKLVFRRKRLRRKYKIGEMYR